MSNSENSVKPKKCRMYSRLRSHINCVLYINNSEVEAIVSNISECGLGLVIYNKDNIDLSKLMKEKERVVFQCYDNGENLLNKDVKIVQGEAVISHWSEIGDTDFVKLGLYVPSNVLLDGYVSVLRAEDYIRALRERS